MDGQNSKFIEYANSVYERQKNEGNEPHSFNEMVRNATKEEQDKMKQLLGEEGEKQGQDKEAIMKEFDALVSLETAEKNSEETLSTSAETISSYLFHRPPEVYDSIYHPIHKSKHQCTRKPKPKPRGVKHGNRKKKK